jgi:hypothetical protein
MFELCERATRQWLQILSSDVDLGKLDYSKLLGNMGLLHAVIMGTSQGTLDDFISALHRKTGGKYQVPDFLRILLAWCPNSRLDLDVFAYFKHAPEIVMAHAIACVSGIGLISEKANQQRNQAIDFLIANRDANIDRLALICLSSNVHNAWMRCSYADHPKKHDVKYLLNRMIQRGVSLTAKPQLKQLPVLSAHSKSKPLLVIPLEGFARDHAMYRCYADIITACREHFYTVGIAGRGCFDDSSHELFDEFFNANELSTGKADSENDLRALEEIIKSWKPDLLYYPSIGMALWVVALANLRLAPVQAMTLGHPATSMSREIDHVLIEQGWCHDNQQLYSEKVVALEDGAAVFKLPQTTARVSPLMAAPVDGVIRVAVPSISQKLTGGFIRALRRVEQAAPNKVQFVFFLGAQLMFYPATVQSLRCQLSNIECHGPLAYDDYIAQLNRCHLHAGTFPFGGTNSLIDSLRQGLPILTMKGDQPHALIDSDFVRRVGLPEEFVCQTEDEYVEKMIELVSSPETLMQWRRYLVNEADIDRVFLQEGKPERYAEALAALLSDEPAAR